jgi:hypothetical protein
MLTRQQDLDHLPRTTPLCKVPVAVYVLDGDEVAFTFDDNRIREKSPRTGKGRVRLSWMMGRFKIEDSVEFRREIRKTGANIHRLNIIEKAFGRGKR